MKTRLLTALVLSAMAIPAVFGQKVTGFPTIRVASAPETATATTMPRRAPLNSTAQLGTNIYGVTSWDYDKFYHFCNLWSEQPSVLTKTGQVLRTDMGDKEDYPEMYMIISGASDGKNWYGYKGRYYTMGYLYVDSWVKGDAATGDYEKLVDMYSDQSSWTYTNDLAWNPADGKMYGLAQSDVLNEMEAVTSKIMTIDCETGKPIAEVKQLDEYYFCMAFNYDGDLYAIRWNYDYDGNLIGTILDIFDEDFNIIQTKTLTVDSKAFKVYYQNTLSFDYTTGNLWWGATDSDADQYLVKIDPQKLTTENKGRIGYQEAIVGMSIPYTTADARTAPAAVSNLKFTIDPNGANKVTLSWTNPTKCWNLSTLKSIAEVLVYRDSYDGEPVATLTDATVGGDMSWVDETATQGIHTYYITACAKQGEKGIASKLEAYVGRDVPGPVEYLNATTTDGKSVHVSWSKPSRGDNDGWYDDSSLQYNIVRMPGEVDLGNTTATSYDDLELPEAQSYTYVVTAFNSDGSGSSSTSPAILAGKSIVIPFSTTFSTELDASRFTYIDKNRDGRTWEYGHNNNKRTLSMKFITSDYDNDDILASPPLAVTKGTTYKVVYRLSFGGSGKSDRVFNNHFALVGGTAATADGMSDTYEDMPDYAIEGVYDNDTDVVSYFTAPVDGDYYIGLEVLNNGEEDMWMYCEGFSVSEAPNNDLEAVSFDTHLVISSVQDNKFEVTVYNNGSNTASGYAVQMAYINSLGNPVVFAENKNAPSLESHETAVVEVIGRPEGVSGNIQVVAVVDWASDGKLDNNTSDPVYLDIDEASALNYTVTTGENEGSSTSIPLTHAYAYSATQTIYNADMLGLRSLGKTVTISRLAYEYTGNEAIDNNDIEIYLSSTSKEGFAEGETTWTPVTGDPAYSDKVKFSLGRNYMVADLDEPFVLDTNEGLMVTLTKYEGEHGDFSILFRVFDDSWYNDIFHTLITRGASEPEINTSLSASRWPEAPVLHLAVEGDGTGVDEVVVAGESSYYFNNLTSSLHVNSADLTAVEVYDLSGRKVSSIPAAGLNDVKVDVANGIYVLSLVRDGKQVAGLKVKVNK
jgi:hypothetical protein